MNLTRLAFALGLTTSMLSEAAPFMAEDFRADRTLLTRLEKIESDYKGPSPGGRAASDFRIKVEPIVRKLWVPSAADEGRGVVRDLNELIFIKLGIKGSQDLKDPDNLFISSVFERKRGYCVGVAALYLVVAERLGLPVHAVATPSHVFLRYDDGIQSINIETLQAGANISDEQYIREQRIPEESIRKGVFMRNLTTEGFLAQIHNNLGVIYSERQNFESAAREYEIALDLAPHTVAAYYNYGNDLLRTGSYRRACHLFSKSLRLYPADPWAFNNRGLAYLKMEKREKAKRDFEEALRIDSGFEQAQRNLQSLQ